MDHAHHHHDHQQNDHHEITKHSDTKPLHDEHAGHHTQDFLRRFWICLALTLPVLLLSHMIQQWFGFHFSFDGDKWLLLLLATIIFLYGGQPFLTGLVRELKYKTPGMMTLVGVAITVAYAYSVAVILGFNGMDFFW